MHTMHLLPSVAIRPNLELKTRPKQLLGSLPLVIVLPTGVHQIHLSNAHIIFPASYAGKGVLNKDTTVWLDGARPPPISLLEQRPLKIVNKCLNTNIYSYLETSGGQNYNLYLNVVHFFNTSLN
jgi:hypothetical protein